MSKLRPYPDYVRTSDLIQIQIGVSGSLQHPGGILGVPVVGVVQAAIGAALGFPENEVFSAMRRHGLIVTATDYSQWNPFVGGWITFSVGASVDFAHLKDTADAAAQAL